MNCLRWYFPIYSGVYVVLLSLVVSCNAGSFRFLKSLWSPSTSATASSSLTSITDSSTTKVIPSLPVHLNESNLGLISSTNVNGTNAIVKVFDDQNSVSPEVLHSLEQRKQPVPNSASLELEVEEPIVWNATLLPTLEPNANVSTYFESDSNEIGGVQAKPPQSSGEHMDEKPFEVLIQNDKTMAHLRFDHSGRDLVHCALYDLEKDPTAVHTVPESTQLAAPLTADYKTILEAIRRCTDLARRQLRLANTSATTTTTTKVALNQTSSATNITNSSSSVNSPPLSPPSTTNSSLIGGASSVTTTTTTTNVTTTTTTTTSGSGVASGAPNSGNNGIKTMWENSHLISVWKGILPGTKWCGLGDSALHYNDLGTKADIDLCCRAHDHCPIRLKAFRMDYGLINFSFYTKSHCDCDEDFFKCLKQSPSANILGNFYFNVLKVQCIKQEIPYVCIKKRTTPNRKEECIQYEMSNKSKMKIVPFDQHFR